ncbi:MAG TPA: type II toxin-antitoxin system PemK/MazF family toxin [Gaiellaceae bacterium]
MIGEIVRGGLYFAAFPGVGDKRVLIVSWNAINAGLRSPIVCLVTSSRRERPLPTDVPLAADEAGMTDESWILCHEIATLDAEDIRGEIGVLLPPLLVQVEAALRQALDLPQP